MILQINAEQTDTLQSAVAVAEKVATVLSMKVSFYYDRVLYTANPPSALREKAITIPSPTSTVEG